MLQNLLRSFANF